MTGICRNIVGQTKSMHLRNGMSSLPVALIKSTPKRGSLIALGARENLLPPINMKRELAKEKRTITEGNRKI
jgi:hypothetical protein